MHSFAGGLIQPPRTRETAHCRKRRDPRTVRLQSQLRERLLKLRREIMRLDQQIRFELSRRHPVFDRVAELRAREQQRSEEVEAIARQLGRPRSI